MTETIPKCAICDSELKGLVWTDTHGVARCRVCGTPYQVLHYEGKGRDRRVVDKPPLLMVKAKYVAAERAYWDQCHRKIPGGFDFVDSRDQDSEAAEDSRLFEAWMAANEAKYMD